MTRLPKPRAILLDWDNTLVDTWPCIGKAANITFEAMGRAPWSEAEIRERVAGSLRDTFPKIYGEQWEEARQIYYKAFEQVHLEMLRALPGAAELLAMVHSRGVYLAIVSNKTGKYLRLEVNHMGWAPLFSKLVGAQDAPRDKPALEPVHMSLKGSGIDLGPDVWFVGDAGIDVECGLAAGCSAVLVQASTYDGAHKPHLHVRDCAAVIEEFEKSWNGGI
ncbi:MAG: HAD family hydrolase [Rhodospirillaceae bacterium]|nr:HAD family hydrolase [Rhodospirillaceae bacterium]